MRTELAAYRPQSATAAVPDLNSAKWFHSRSRQHMVANDKEKLLRRKVGSDANQILLKHMEKVG